MPGQPNTPAGGPKNYSTLAAESQEENVRKNTQNLLSQNCIFCAKLPIDKLPGFCYNTIRKRKENQKRKGDKKNVLCS